jgi:hypothetical protein
MGKAQYPQYVLSEALKDKIRERKVLAACFLTFQFDPVFFELHVLPILFSKPFSHIYKLKLAQLEDSLRDIDYIAVYYDARGLISENGTATLDYERHGIVIPGGVFHAKNILILVENEDNSQKWESLILFTMSANMTRSGWWENLEVSHVIEIDSTSWLRDDLLGLGQRKGLIDYIINYIPYDAKHAALERIRRFLKNSIGSVSYKSQGGIIHPRLYIGRETFSEFIVDEIKLEAGEYNLEIVSPFFDVSEDAPAIKKLIESVKPKATRIFLPMDDVGNSLCSESYYNSVSALHRVGWGKIPENPPELTRWDKKGKSESRRFVHAKIYRFFSKPLEKEFIIIGSVNLTDAAHCGSKKKNFETALFYDASGKGNYEWFLEDLDSEEKRYFIEKKPEDDLEGLSNYCIALLYNWKSNSLSYFWKSDSISLKNVVIKISSNEISLGQVKYNSWQIIPETSTGNLRECILGTSIAELYIDGMFVQRILIQEEGMEMRPSALKNLTTSEILEYWSLLSEEQKAEFIATRLDVINVIQGPSGHDPVIDDKRETLFDKFAGIFHAFSCLQEEIIESYHNKQEKKSVYRLFGDKYDSFKSLLEKLMKEIDSKEEHDPIISYVIYLSMLQTLEVIKGTIPKFFDSHKRDFKLLDENLKRAGKIKEKIDFGKDATADTFFKWYEELFIKKFKK